MARTQISPAGAVNKTHRPFHSLVPLSPHHATTLYVILINHRMQTSLIALRLANPVILADKPLREGRRGTSRHWSANRKPSQVRLHSHSGRIVMCSCSATCRSHRSYPFEGFRRARSPLREPIESSREYRYGSRSTLHASLRLSTLDGTTGRVSMRWGIRLSGSASCVCNNHRESAVLI